MIGHKLLDDSKLFTLLRNNESITLWSYFQPLSHFFFVQKVRVILQTTKCTKKEGMGKVGGERRGKGGGEEVKEKGKGGRKCKRE